MLYLKEMDKSAQRVVERFAMARGTVVVDENVQELADALRKVNIRCIIPRAGMPDSEIISDLLPNRIIITKNSRDFRQFASSYDFGIISLDHLSFIDKSEDPAQNKTVQLISRAFVDHSLWSKRHGFMVTLTDHAATYEELTD